MTKYERFMAEMLRRPFLPDAVALDVMHPWNSPLWFRGVEASIPVEEFAKMVGFAGADLALEQVNTEQWRREHGYTKANAA